MVVVAWGGIPRTQTQTMKNKRKRHDSQFKARVALEALKGLKTVQQIAKEFGIHPGQVSVVGVRQIDFQNCRRACLRHHPNSRICRVL